MAAALFRSMPALVRVAPRVVAAPAAGLHMTLRRWAGALEGVPLDWISSAQKIKFRVVFFVCGRRTIETRYSQSHEWVRKEDDNTYTVGITDFAQVG
jgi:hypothetical protein